MISPVKKSAPDADCSPVPRKKKKRKFNFSYFKRLSSTHKMIDYAEENLTYLGEGTSRIVFEYNGKALKIAMNDKGFAQNFAEKTIYNEKKSRCSIAEIFTVSKFSLKYQGYAWIVSELIRPIVKEAEFQELVGCSWEVYKEVIEDCAKETVFKSEPSQAIKLVTSRVTTQFAQRAERLHTEGDERNARYYSEKLKEVEKIEKSLLLRGIVNGMIAVNLLPGDLTELDHYGKSADGRAILLDYGLTQDVARRFYPKTPASKKVPAKKEDVLTDRLTITTRKKNS